MSVTTAEATEVPSVLQALEHNHSMSVQTTTRRRSLRIAAKQELSSGEDIPAPKPSRSDFDSSIDGLDDPQDEDATATDIETPKPQRKKRTTKRKSKTEPSQDNTEDSSAPPKRKRASKRKSETSETDKPPRKKKKASNSPSTEEPVDMANLPLRDIISMCSSRATRKKRVKNENSSSETKSETPVEVPSNPPEEEQAVPVSLAPKLRIENGKIVAAKDSLVHSAPAISKRPVIEATDEPRMINSASFRKCPLSAKRWTPDENKKFYTALRMFGTDFLRISYYVETRNRAQIRNKYKKEESCNPHLIEYALANRIPITLDVMNLILEKSGCSKIETSEDTQNASTAPSILDSSVVSQPVTADD